MKNNAWFKLIAVSFGGAILSLVILMGIQSFNQNSYNMNQGQRYNIQGTMNTQGNMGMMGGMNMQGNMSQGGGMMDDDMKMQGGMGMMNGMM